MKPYYFQNLRDLLTHYSDIILGGHPCVRRSPSPASLERQSQPHSGCSPASSSTLTKSDFWPQVGSRAGRQLAFKQASSGFKKDQVCHITRNQVTFFHFFIILLYQKLLKGQKYFSLRHQKEASEWEGFFSIKSFGKTLR